MIRYSFCTVNWVWRAKPAERVRSSGLYRFMSLLNRWRWGVYGRQSRPYIPHLPRFIEIIRFVI